MNRLRDIVYAVSYEAGIYVINLRDSDAEPQKINLNGLK